MKPGMTPLFLWMPRVDGPTVAHDEPVNRGAADRPLGDAEIVAKLHTNAALAVSRETAVRMATAMLGLDQASDPMAPLAVFSPTRWAAARQKGLRRQNGLVWVGHSARACAIAMGPHKSCTIEPASGGSDHEVFDTSRRRNGNRGLAVGERRPGVR